MIHLENEERFMNFAQQVEFVRKQLYLSRSEWQKRWA